MPLWPCCQDRSSVGSVCCCAALFLAKKVEPTLAWELCVAKRNGRSNVWQTVQADIALGYLGKHNTLIGKLQCSTVSSCPCANYLLSRGCGEREKSIVVDASDEDPREDLCTARLTLQVDGRLLYLRDAKPATIKGLSHYTICEWP